MPILKCCGFDEKYLNRLKREAFRRYGTTYGSIGKLLYEYIDNEMKQSKEKPPFDSLVSNPPLSSYGKKNKKTNKVELRYETILDKLKDLGVIVIEDHYKLMHRFVKETWNSRHTWADKEFKLVGMWKKRYGEFGERLKEENHD